MKCAYTPLHTTCVNDGSVNPRMATFLTPFDQPATMVKTKEFGMVTQGDSEDSGKGSKANSKALCAPILTVGEILKREHRAVAQLKGRGEEAQDPPAVGVQAHAAGHQQPQAHVRGLTSRLE